MEFRTEWKPAASSLSIGWSDSICTMGSCFADSLGKQLKDSKFQTLVNPFGTTYHPLSIHHHLELMAGATHLRVERLTPRAGTWCHFDFHSSLSGSSPSDVTQSIKARIRSSGEWLRSARVLILTYGTAWIYEDAHGVSVANCHKVPSTQFTKRLTPVSEMVESFKRLRELLTRLVPHLTIILTVSPVRHTRDTLPLNAVSKSALRLLCHEVADHERVFYFPSYEIMMDDLRDYRYYADDLLHPSTMATQYIWEKFSETYFNAGQRQLNSSWEDIQRLLNHRVQNPGTVEHLEFLDQVRKKLMTLATKTDVHSEITLIEDEISRYGRK